eukprot:1574087-Amphidinium_carterae.2
MQWRKLLTQAISLCLVSGGNNGCSSMAVARDAQLMERYKPMEGNIVGMPVNNMSELVPASDNHVYIPIRWNSDCVQPPYADFYLDGHRLLVVKVSLDNRLLAPL